MDSDMDPFDATPEEKQAALLRALQMKMGQGQQQQPQAADFLRGQGNLGLMSGDKVLSNVAQAQLGQAQQLSGQAQEAKRFGLTQAIEAQKRATDQQFQGEQRDLDREVRKDEMRQRGLDRALQREMMGLATSDKRQEKAAETRAKDVKELSEDVDKFGAPAFYQKAGEVSAIVNDPKYKDDLPGVGPVAGRLPDFMTSADGVNLRQAAGQMLAEYRKGITGSGMSEGEKQEYSQITGLMNGGNEKAYVSGFERLRRAMDARVSGRAAGTPGAAEEYATRQPWMKDALSRSSGVAVVSEVKEGKDIIQKMSDGSYRVKP